MADPMRIIAGARKGARIDAPDGAATRPTTDRVREALFNVLEHGDRPSEGAYVLDLFAGSGALGLEALSRGAELAVFVETGLAARAVIRRNAESLRLLGAARIFKRDATRLGRRPTAFPRPFDLIFCDPPYGQDLGPAALESALAQDWIAPGAVAVLEQGGREDETPPKGFALLDARRYGDTKLLILRAQTDAHNTP